MIEKIEPICERCGKCCNGYTFWMTNRSFDNDPTEIKRLIEYHNLVVLKNKKGEMGIHIPGACVHLEMIDGKSKCKIYDNRPVVCQEYYCEKVIKKALKEMADGLCVQ